MWQWSSVSLSMLLIVSPAPSHAAGCGSLTGWTVCLEEPGRETAGALAASYLYVKRFLPFARQAVEGGHPLSTPDGISVDAAHISDFEALGQAYAEEIEARGYPQMAGRYEARGSGPCAGIGDATITQSAFAIDMKVGSSARLSGVVVEGTLMATPEGIGVPRHYLAGRILDHDSFEVVMQDCTLRFHRKGA